MDNYYEEDIKYQQQYDKIKNTSELTTKVKLDFDSAKGDVAELRKNSAASRTFLLFAFNCVKMAVVLMKIARRTPALVAALTIDSA